jgi:hypothetical protein
MIASKYHLLEVLLSDKVTKSYQRFSRDEAEGTGVIISWQKLHC